MGTCIVLLSMKITLGSTTTTLLLLHMLLYPAGYRAILILAPPDIDLPSTITTTTTTYDPITANSLF